MENKIYTIKLIDFKGKIKNFDISCPSDSIIIYTKQCGDDVIYIYKNNRLLYTLDSSEERIYNLLDEIKLISLDELLKLNYN